MTKRLFFLLFAFTFLPHWAFANLSVSAFYILFDANSPKRSDVLRVTNSSGQRKTYRIKMINYKQNADGSYTPISQPISGNPFASPYINFSPHETTLEPGQSQTVRLVRKPMAAAPDGEYVSHLFIQEMPEKAQTRPNSGDKLQIDIKALYGVTIPVIIEKGNLQSSAELGKVSVSSKYAEVVVKRRGNRSFWGNLIVMQGKKEIGRVNGFKIFMTSPERHIKIPLEGYDKQPARIILEDARTNAALSSKNI